MEVIREPFKLFVQEGNSHIRILKNGKITKDFSNQYAIAKFLNVEDLQNLRSVNGFCNNWVKECPHFVDKITGRISDSWNKQIVGVDMENMIHWKSFHITHFAVRRLSMDFPKYLCKTGMGIKELAISHSTLGSLALSYILNSCRQLESLTLDAVRFRDVDQLSDYTKPLLLEHTLPNQNTVEISEAEKEIVAQARRNEAIRIRRAFKNLTISNTFMMEDNAVVQLMDRSQFLQSVSLINCCKDYTNKQCYDKDKSINRGISFLQRCKTFMTCFGSLLEVNLGSVTHLEIDNCHLHEEVLEIFAPFFHKLSLTNLSLNIPQSKPGFCAPAEKVLEKLFVPECDWTLLEHLSLEYYGPISEIHIENLLKKSATTLKSLRLITHTNDPFKESCLKTALREMKVLETLYIVDAKEVPVAQLKESRKLLPARKLREGSTKMTTNCLHSDLSNEERLFIESDYCQEFLHCLPSTLKEISLCGITRSRNFHEVLQMAQNIPQTILNLTSLEIRGPNLSYYDLTFGKLISQMKMLRSLTLSNCDLNDAHLTGLSVESASTMRKSGTYLLGLENYMYGSNHMKCSYPLKDVDLLKDITSLNWGGPSGKGFAFSDIPQLQHLDLSSNYGISDVTIFYALKIPSLKILSLESCPKITDSGLEFIPSQLTNLEEINLRHCRRLSKHGLNRLVHFSPKIKRIITTKVIQNNDYGRDIPERDLPSFNRVVCCDAVSS